MEAIIVFYNIESTSLLKCRFEQDKSAGSARRAKATNTEQNKFNKFACRPAGGMHCVHAIVPHPSPQSPPPHAARSMGNFTLSGGAVTTL